MRRLMAALAVCCLVLGVGGAVSPALAAPPTTNAEASRQINAWMEASAAWIAPYNKLTAEQGDLIYTVSAGTNQARRYAQEGRFDEGRAWAQTWTAEQRAKLVDLRARLSALPKSPPGLKGPTWDLRSFPEARTSQAMFDAVPRVSDQELTYNEKLVDQALKIIEAAAGGNRSAIKALQPLYFDMNAASLTASNNINALFVPGLERDHSPKATTFRAAIAVNEALITSYKLLRTHLAEQPIDRPAAAAALRANADQIDVAVRDMGPRARALKGAGVSGELARKFDAVIAAYGESGVALTDLAGRIRSLADVITQGDTLDVERVIDAIDAMGPSMDRFFDLERQRASLLG